MSQTNFIKNDNSSLSRIEQKLRGFESILTLMSGICIFMLVLLSVVNVMGRWLFNLPVSGYIDMVEQAMAVFAFLGIAYSQGLGSHIRMDIVISHLHGRAYWVAELITCFLMLFITLILIYGSFLHAWRAFDIGDSSIDIGLPTWPAKLVVPVSLLVLAVRLILQIWAYGKAIRHYPDVPVAVPLASTNLESSSVDSDSTHSPQA